jgi:hypothetical protein
MKNIQLLPLALTMLLVVAGCSEVQPVDTAEPEPTISQAEPEPTQTQEPMAEGPKECEAQTQRAIEATVNSQTSAFASDNFEIAYSYASPSFRSNVTLEGFVGIIAGSYGPLIESSQLSFSDCLVDLGSGLALIDVRFLQSGNDVYALRYLMIETMAGWRVQGASNLQLVGEGT